MRKIKTGLLPGEPGIDAVHGNMMMEFKAGVTSIRSIRASLMQLAYAAARNRDKEGYLVLPDLEVTDQRIRAEWEDAGRILRPDIYNRLNLFIGQGGQYRGWPREIRDDVRKTLNLAIKNQGLRPAVQPVRSASSYVIPKIMLYLWLKNKKPATTKTLQEISGYSYPSVAGALRSLGSLIERQSDRRVTLRMFPREEYARMRALSEQARSTARFADKSGQPRSPEFLLQRLEKLDIPGMAIGGVPGARHYLPSLDIAGLPRLDISLHSRRREMDLGFMAKLDPGLERVTDPLAPASVVVHAVRQAEPLFEKRGGGLKWADPVDCLFDLHENRLEIQAAQFLEALKEKWPGESNG